MSLKKIQNAPKRENIVPLWCRMDFCVVLLHATGVRNEQGRVFVLFMESAVRGALRMTGWSAVVWAIVLFY